MAVTHDQRSGVSREPNPAAELGLASEFASAAPLPAMPAWRRLYHTVAG